MMFPAKALKSLLHRDDAALSAWSVPPGKDAGWAPSSVASQTPSASRSPIAWLSSEPADAGADPPALAFAVQPDQVIGGAIAGMTRGSGGRWRAEDRNYAADRARCARGQRANGLPMDMAMQDRLGAEVADHAFESGGVREPAQRRRNPARRRVMDEHDPRQAFGAGLAQEFGEGLDLSLAEPAVAIRGPVGTAELKPIIAISPRTRR